MKPRALRPGDLIRLVSPASCVRADQIEFAVKLLEDAGYRVDLAPHALDSHYYLAGRDADRAADLQVAFEDPEVSAIFCTRGGYGCSRLLPFLDLDRIAGSGKLFAGFSDITVLHTALNNRGMPTLHAPMALTLSTPRDTWVYTSLLDSLSGGNPVPMDAPRGVRIVGGCAEGVVVGGCMILLCDSLGTPEAIDPAGKVLLLEDVDENPHRVDAMLTHLLNHGGIARAAAIVVGEMTRTDERSDASIGTWPWREIVTDRLAPLGIPLIVDFPFGHAKQMLTLPLGVRASVNADEGILTYLEPHCE